MNVIYDAVICVGEQHNDIAIKSIRSLLLFSDARKIFTISSVQILERVKKNVGEDSRIFFLDEDQLIAGIDINCIKEILKQRIGSEARAGWYFQQFLKMGASGYSEIADHYLVWDSDTILLKPIVFFDDEERVLVNAKSEYHEPYFLTLSRVLGIDKQVSFSFISEHLMVKKEFMKLLVENLSANTPPGTTWVEYILYSIDNKDLGKSGFSEYETYGNFIALKFKDSFTCRRMNSTRHGTMYFGTRPDKYAFFWLMLSGYTFATFESWHQTSRLKCLTRKSIARAIYIYCFLTMRCSRWLKAAAELAR